MLIDLDNIDHDDADNVRRTGAGEAADASLQASIAAMGVLQPILVIHHSDRYRLVDGARRVAACRALGHAQIAAELAPRADEAWATAAAAAANMVRADMSPVDRWRIMRRLQDLGYTLPAASSALGLSTRAGKRLDRLSRLHPLILAAMEGGDMPDDEDMAVIAAASPERQEAAIANAGVVRDGTVNWYGVASQLRTDRITQSDAIFDIAAHPEVTWTEDLFAQGGAEEWYTEDVAAFIVAQRAALEAEVGASRGELMLGKIGQHDFIPAVPKMFEQVYGAVPDKPKRGTVHVVAVRGDGTIARIVVKAAKKGTANATPAPEPEPEDSADAGATDAKPAAASTKKPEPEPEGRFPITLKGLEIIASEKTLALQRAARAMAKPPVHSDTLVHLLALLVLALGSRHVAVTEGRYGRVEFKDLAAQIVPPAGGEDLDLAKAPELAAEALARMLQVTGLGPNADPVPEWIGQALDAATHLNRFDTEEFMREVTGDTLRAAAQAASMPSLPKKVSELRKAAIGAMPDWRPAQTGFAAPGPKPPKKPKKKRAA
jgi:ParB family transcriptional regulator, chromosome partitioning protein